MAKKTRVLISFDYALKRLLRNKANFDVLEGFLSELLMQDVAVRNILESESNQTHIIDKQNRVDIMVEDEKGELIIIELQFAIEFDYLQRMLYGASKAVTEYMTEGLPYAKVRKVYAIHIVYFDLGQGDDYIYHGTTVFRGLHTHNELLLSDVQRVELKRESPSDLFPEYYILNVKRFDEVAKSALDEWVYFLKTNTIREEFTAKGLDKARELLDYDKLSDEERREYEALRHDRSEKLSMVASAKAEGRFEGRMEGKMEATKQYEPIIAEKDAALAAERKALAEKDATLAEKDATLAAERKANAEKDAALAAALAELDALRKQ
jgi:predicted transposase/invertase (TIGR01784 family)